MARIEPSAYEPDVAIPPGETVAELMRDYEMSVPQLSESTGLGQDSIAALLRGELEISLELAGILSERFRLPVHFWVNLERNYRSAVQRLKPQAEIVEGIERFMVGSLTRKEKGA